MRLRPGDYVEGQLLFAPQFYEAEERAWVQQHLRPGDVFADLGAHAGLYTLLAARAVGPAGCVIAVEANPETFARLQENLRENGFEQVRAFDCGVSDRAEVRKLGHTGAANTGAASFLAEGGGEEEVECLPLLTILERAAVQRLDGLKLDIEGFEHRVLERFFADVPVSLYPDFVLLEHKQRLIARAGGDALALLQRHGYRAVLEAKGRRDWSNFGLVHEKAMRCGLGEEREP